MNNQTNQIVITNEEYNKQKGQILALLKYLYPEHSTFQIIAIRPRNRKTPVWGNEFVFGEKGTASGYFQDHEVASQSVLALDANSNALGVYLTLNPCSKDLLARANHRIKANCEGVKNSEVDRFCNLLIDIDPKRPSGISSTDEEHKYAIDTANKIKKEAMANGWPEPLVASSGNGAHLIFKLDLKYSAENATVINNTLQSLHEVYSDEKVDIDMSVGNPARLTKVYGTTARKGDHISDRPHRLAHIISIPEEPQPVPLELLQGVANTVTQKETIKSAITSNGSTKQFEFDVAAYLNHYGIHIVKTEQHGSATLFCLEKCVFDSSHGPNKAAIGQTAQGKLFYNCFHNSCRGKTWNQARQQISGDDSLLSFMQSDHCKVEDIKLIGSIVSGDDLINTQFGEDKMIIENILGEKEVTLFSGPGGIGKSVLTLNIALHLGSPMVNDIWGFKVNNQTSTLFIQSENSAKSTKSRLQMMSKDKPALAQGVHQLFFPSITLDDIRITGQSLTDEVFRQFLVEKIYESGAKLIVFDPLISFHMGDENDNSGMRTTLDYITSICDTTNSSAIVIHHVGKDYFKNSTYSGRGASAIGDWCDNGFLMSAGTKEFSGAVKLACQKARNFEKPEAFYLKLNNELVFEPFRQGMFHSVRNPNVVVKALEAMGGSVTRQTDLINKIEEISRKSTGTVRILIDQALQLGFIQENNDPNNKRKKGYKITKQHNDHDFITNVLDHQIS